MHAERLLIHIAEIESLLCSLASVDSELEPSLQGMGPAGMGKRLARHALTGFSLLRRCRHGTDIPGGGSRAGRAAGVARASSRQTCACSQPTFLRLRALLHAPPSARPSASFLLGEGARGGSGEVGLG